MIEFESILGMGAVHPNPNNTQPKSVFTCTILASIVAILESNEIILTSIATILASIVQVNTPLSRVLFEFG